VYKRQARSGDEISVIDKSDVFGINKLLAEMDAYNVSQTLLVSMKGIENTDQKKYFNVIKPYSNRLIPIAFFELNDNITQSNISKKLFVVKSLGYKGIKLHPRISGFSIQSKLLEYAIKRAYELKLSVLLCTYFYDNLKLSLATGVDQLSDLLYRLNGARVILLHGGSVRLLETIEIVRSFNNTLLDLSFTICKYEGSSIDLDIQYAFNSFDRRICVGSDFPEFQISKLRERFDYYSRNISRKKAENIAFRNILQFLRDS